MRYTVTWFPDAEAELTNLWNNAWDRQEIANAADRMERSLKRDAEQKGWAEDGQRILIDPPLAMTFIVSLDDCLVTIVWVERIGWGTELRQQLREKE